MSNQNPGGGQPWQGNGSLGGQPWRPDAQQPGGSQPWQPNSNGANSPSGQQPYGQSGQPAGQYPQQSGSQSQAGGQSWPGAGGSAQQFGGGANSGQYSSQQYPGQQNSGQAQGSNQGQYPAGGYASAGQPQPGQPYQGYGQQPAQANFGGQQPPQQPNKSSNKMIAIIAGVVALVLLVSVGVWAATRDPEPEPTPATTTPARTTPGRSTPARSNASPTDGLTPGRSASSGEKPRTGGNVVDLGEGVVFNLPEGWEVLSQDGPAVVIQYDRKYMITVTAQSFGAGAKDAQAVVDAMAEGVKSSMEGIEVVKPPASVNVGSKGTGAAATMSGKYGGRISQTHILSAIRRNKDGMGVMIIAIATGDEADGQKLEGPWKSVFDDIAKSFLK